MATYNLRSTTAVVVKPYEYEGADAPKPIKADLEYTGGTTYGEVTLVGVAVADYLVGDIVVYATNAGVETKINNELVRIIDETNIYYHLS